MVYISIGILTLYIVALVYGAFCFFRKKTPLYFHLLFFAVVCFFMEKLYFAVNFICTGSLETTFNFAIVGSGAAFSFMLSANYGQFDSLVDDGSKEYAKYRHLAIIAPIITGLLSGLVALSYIKMQHGIFFVIILLLVNIPGILASYFNMKLLIFPKMFMVESLRSCNAMGLAVIIVTILSELGIVIGKSSLSMAIETICAACLIIWMICAERGYRGWKI